MRVTWSGDLVVKESESEHDRVRLRREAATLRAVAHPAIVRLAKAGTSDEAGGPERLALHRVVGTALSESPPQPASVAAGWGAAVATVVADLHDLGYVHGAITPEHVLIDEQGRPILCGFGHARRIESVDSAAVAEDVRAVARLVDGILASGHDGLRRMLRRWIEGRHRRGGDARTLAQALVDEVPEAAVRPLTAEAGVAHDGESPGEAGAGLLGDVRGASSMRRVAASVGAARLRPGRAWWAVAGLAVATAIGLVFVHLSQSATSGGRRTEVRREPSPSAGGSSPVYLLQSVPGAHPITVVGRWACGPPRPAVLDPSSGSVWVLPAWPAGGGKVEGRLIERYPGASGLAVVSDGPGCDRLLLVRAGGAELPVTVGPGG